MLLCISPAVTVWLLKKMRDGSKTVTVMKIYLGTIFCYKLRVILLLVRYRYSPGTSLFTRVADPCSYYTNPDSETENAAFFIKLFNNVRFFLNYFICIPNIGDEGGGEGAFRSFRCSRGGGS